LCRKDIVAPFSEKKMLFYVVLFSMLISTTWATYGVDVSQSTSVAAFQCLKSTFAFSKSMTYICYFGIGISYEFAIVRVYQQIGQVDPNGAQTIKNARDAGIPYVDGYIFPCLRCGNPAQQVFDFVFSFNAFLVFLSGY
jgi:hypothetical protein